MINHSVDYWSVVVGLSAEHKLDLEQRLERKVKLIAEVLPQREKTVAYSIRYIRPGDFFGEYQYLVSVWGFGTSQLIAAIPELQTPPTRVDFRAEFSCGSETFHQLRNLHTVSPFSKVSFNSYNSRTRQKEEERDRGGLGFAYGSLKSRKRVSVYRSNISPFAAVEVQLRKEAAMVAGAAYLEALPDYYSTDDYAFVNNMRIAERKAFEEFAEPVLQLYTGWGSVEYSEVGDRQSNSYKELQEMYAHTLLSEVTPKRKTPRNQSSF